MIWSAIYILLLALEADGNLIDSRNVFGWQKQKIKKHHHHSRPAIRTSSSSSSSAAGGISSSFSPSSSPLRRSENVFGWQQPKASRGSRTSQHVQQQRGRKTKEAGSNDAKTIIHTASSTSQEDYYNNDIENDSNTKHNNNNLNYLSPPSIKVQLQPRKKELWLPWPLGAMRNDFYKFANEQRRSGRGSLSSGNGRVQEWHPRGSSKSQHQYSSNNGYREQQEGILSQGKDWATSILRKTGTMLPFPFIEFNNNNEQNERRRHGDGATTTIDSESSAGYWIKETTTPMATASSISQNNNNNKQQGKKKKKKQQGKRTNNHNGAVLRGGDDDANNDHDGEKSYDKDVLCQYLKLQASVRLRQLGYGTFFSIIC